MIRTTAFASILVLSIAGPAMADTPPASPPPPPSDKVARAAEAPSASTADAPAPAAAPAEAATTDAFGLPCEVTFSPRSTAMPAKGAKGKKGAKAAKGAKSAKSAAPAAFGTGSSGRGGEFALGRIDRGASKPSGEAEVRMQAATVTTSMVGVVVREHAAELELCMARLPKDQRAATVALVLTIEADGTASAAKVTGAPKATEFNACLAAVARTWAYPHTDAAATIEYPLTLNGSR
jgi:hypothetical protein